jgi:hypothetical protein
MANQVLAATVINLIRKPWISNVRFTLSGLSVFAWRYEAVAMAISRGKITCEVGVPADTNLQPGFIAVGRYEPKPRELRFPNEQYGSSSDREKFNMVHEATHASFDCQYGTSTGKDILAIDDEAAAWLAQAVYMLESPYFWNGPMMPGDPIDEATKLANKLRAVPTYYDQGSPPYNVPSADTLALKRSVAKVYDLEGGKAGIVHTYYGLTP